LKPDADQIWGYSNFSERISRYWEHPTFGLEHHLPYVSELLDYLQGDNPRDAEYFVLNLKYEYLKQVEQDHEFDLVAVVIYVLRWHLVDRWTRQNPEEAVKTFDECSCKVVEAIERTLWLDA
jgi:hypothetical protein